MSTIKHSHFSKNTTGQLKTWLSKVTGLGLEVLMVLLQWEDTKNIFCNFLETIGGCESSKTVIIDHTERF